MPAGKQSQGSATTIALVVFVVLFLLSTVAAVFFYVKWDEKTTIAEREVANRREAATDQQVSEFESLVGEKTAQSYLGTVIERFDEVYQEITGSSRDKNIQSAAENISLEVKALRNRFPNMFSQDAGLLPIAGTLAGEYVRSAQTVSSLQDKIAQMEEDWQRDVEGFKVAEEKLIEQKQKLIEQADQIQAKFDQMKSEAQQNAQENIDALQEKLAEKNSQLEDVKNELADLQASFKEQKQYREKLEKQLEQIKPSPDMDVAAYKPDGRIVSVNAQQGIVYLDLGSDANIYRGLTFAVYDRANPVPKDGKGKAEIKIYDVRSKVSVAKIISQEQNNPVLPEDIIVNLIWDEEKPNTFYVAGNFDLDGNGTIDEYGGDKVRHLIKQWGGIVADKIDINTDFVVAGQPPEVYQQPQENELDADLAEQKYQESLDKYETYNSAIERAQSLSIPVFNTERFKSLIGYNQEIKNNMTK
ncbi:hypothetical protein L21SP3_01545 [Sedimentisphaera cyanobacteriorum]|uniref:Uncharacterized protein n=1 Tax=Sedimentisphaera cyanobacteriorum TaxID=1940790 RepID=A0A1Q2HR81_9BACT|nr:hypothetical protein [Sedimentisphaera cyanobacteriorum]AQQ09733.1 hypothetical protein L21SP3_01545 [Sedimentisphaera cyanobacteriorum]